MKEIVLKDIDDGEVLAILTVPETVGLAEAKKEIFKLRDNWLDNEEGYYLTEYLKQHCPEGWVIDIPAKDNRDVIEI